MVKITDEKGEFGWGEATLEGHDLAVEGCLEEMIPRIIGKDAKFVLLVSPLIVSWPNQDVARLRIFGSCFGDTVSTEVALSS